MPVIDGLVCITDIEAKQIEWLWEPFIPLGKFTDVAGQMGQGKSLFTIHMAARVSKEGGSVLLYAGEDDFSDTVRPRLEVAGADLDKIFRVEDEQITTERVDEFCDALGDVRLVIVDPITGFFPPRTDPWNTPQVRRFLTPHVALAAERRFALLGIQHLNRRADSDPLARIADAQGIPQVARSVLVWGPDPEDPGGSGGDLKVLALVKGNHVAGRPAMSWRKEGCRTDGGIDSARIVLLDSEREVDASDIVSQQERRPATKTEEAEAWLDRYLQREGTTEASIVQAAAERAGITAKCLRSAREAVAWYERPGGNRGPYVYRLRPDVGD